MGLTWHKLILLPSKTNTLSIVGHILFCVQSKSSRSYYFPWVSIALTMKTQPNQYVQKIADLISVGIHYHLNCAKIDAVRHHCEENSMLPTFYWSFFEPFLAIYDLNPLGLLILDLICTPIYSKNVETREETVTTIEFV